MSHLLPVLTPFENKLIARIWANPDFTMADINVWPVDGTWVRWTPRAYDCGTAQCIAGEIILEAKPKASELFETWEDAASKAYCSETGLKKCNLDFLGRWSEKPLSDITRAEAVWHVATRGAGWTPPQGGPRFPEERARIEKEMGR